MHGIELSEQMITQLRAQDAASNIGVTLCDFATATVAGTFSVVYLLRNTITNLTTQDEQVECFSNAARHLQPGGAFVIENYVPELRRLPPGETTHVFTATPTHVGVAEYDVVNQIDVSRHWWTVEGELVTFSSPHRYVWPTELDLGPTRRHGAAAEVERMAARALHLRQPKPYLGVGEDRVVADRRSCGGWSGGVIRCTFLYDDAQLPGG